jgi:adenosylcobyric acid synthase
MGSGSRTRYITVLGTQSSAGKSILVTALCRLLRRRGCRVAPFKAQNMSLNSWVTVDGKEIGMAQAVQAFAAGVEPRADMNPVLLKPKGDTTSQVIVLGEPLGDRKVGEYYVSIDEMMGISMGALRRLADEYGHIVMEGAGGAAEINLYDKDIANSRMARAVGSPIVIVGDIELGGVFASLYGTYVLLPEEDKKLVKGFIINKFRGDASLLKPGIERLEEMTGVPVLGVIPYRRLSILSEDSMSIDNKRSSGALDIDIAVVRLPHISNFTDFEPLERLARVRYIRLDDELGRPDIVIIPGTKNTVSDLKAFSGSALWNGIKSISGDGTPVLGICGGYQMLGEQVIDHGIEGNGEEAIAGMGLLPVTTTFDRYEKLTQQASKTITADGPILGPIKGTEVAGYEIHMGKSISRRPAFEDDGCVSPSGTVIGTYMHGLFENGHFTGALLRFACEKKGIAYEPESAQKNPYDELADMVEASLDMKKLFAIIEDNQPF